MRLEGRTVPMQRRLKVRSSEITSTEEEEPTMRDAARAERRAEIERAAYALLEENGYAGMSMLGVAKRARASNETLYRWYGNKQGLIKAMVARNAAIALALWLSSTASAAAQLDTLGRGSALAAALVFLCLYHALPILMMDARRARREVEWIS